MTTAHRATWKAARGGVQEQGSFRLHAPSAAVSSKDAPTERDLKLRRDLDLSRGQLRSRLDVETETTGDGIELLEEPIRKRPRSRFSSASIRLVTDGCEDENEKEEKNNSDDDDEEEESSDEEEDEAELRAEVEKIRREKEVERAKLAAAKEEEEQTKRIANANPLLGDLNSNSVPPPPQSVHHDDFSETASIATGSVAFSVRRRWDDDVVFRNQASTGGERAPQARFINDTIHNDFHKRFMKKYMR